MIDHHRVVQNRLRRDQKEQVKQFQQITGVKCKPPCLRSEHMTFSEIVGSARRIECASRIVILARGGRDAAAIKALERAEWVVEAAIDNYFNQVAR